MKGILIFLCCIVASGGFAQSGVHTIDSSYAYCPLNGDTSKLELTSKLVYYRRADCKLDSIAEFSWENDSKSWKNARRFIYSYDSLDRLTEERNLAWSPQKGIWQWLLRSKTEYRYNAKGNIILHYITDYDIIFNTTPDHDSIKLTYDSTFRLTRSLLKKEHNGGRWSNYSRTRYFYDSLGQHSESRRERFKLLQWVDDEIVTKRRGPKGELLEEITKEYNRRTREWIPTIIRTFTYDKNGNRTSESSSFDNPAAGSFIRKCTYDPLNRLVRDYSFNSVPRGSPPICHSLTHYFFSQPCPELYYQEDTILLR